VLGNNQKSLWKHRKTALKESLEPDFESRNEFFKIQGVFAAGVPKILRWKDVLGLILQRLGRRNARNACSKDAADPQVYRPINNMTIRTANRTTRIDHFIASKYGIFAVEMKNIKGWIYGDEKQALLDQKTFKN
jgi:hypothetical protein